MGLLDTQIPNASADAVAVFDQSFNQVFSGARPIKVDVKEGSKVMDHPIERGSTISDHVVIIPNEIVLNLLLLSNNIVDNFRSVYQQIKQLWQSHTILTVQTRTDTYQNMIISEIPHDEAPDMFDAVMMTVKLREVPYVSPQYGTLPPSSVANKSQASTVKKGEQQTSDATEEEKPQASVMAEFFGVVQ